MSRVSILEQLQKLSYIRYFDVQSTTPLDPRVLEAMLPYWTWNYGNPHSKTHMFGNFSEQAIDIAREQIASLINASDPSEIIFTSGATESNNISIKGIANFITNNNQSSRTSRPHIITCQTEHKCVLDSCRSLQYRTNAPVDVTYLPVGRDGCIDIKHLTDAIRPETCLVSIMAVNNEIGVIQPLQAIGEICKQYNIPFHTDAAQAVGKIPLDVQSMNIHLMSISAHKMYGPKGIGALYVRRKPRVRLQPLFSGGGQERGIRSGTVPTPLAVGMGVAAEICKREMTHDKEHITTLSRAFLDTLHQHCSHTVINGSMEEGKRWFGNLNISFAGVEGESLMAKTPYLAVSSGSACTSSSLEPSYVLRALGINDELAHTSLRIGIGRFTTLEHVTRGACEIATAVKALREMSPLWDEDDEA